MRRLTVKIHESLVASEGVGCVAFILSVVCLFLDMYTETECQSMLSFVVSLDTMLRRAGHPSSVLLPVVDGVRVGCYLTFKNSLSTTPLNNAIIRHVDLRGN